MCVFICIYIVGGVRAEAAVKQSLSCMGVCVFGTGVKARTNPEAATRSSLKQLQSNRLKMI